MEKMLELQVKVPVSDIVDELLSRFAATPRAATAAVGSIPRIGEYWAGQGGINAGLMRGVNGLSDYFLIVAPADRVTFGELEYGPRKSVIGTDDEYDGQKNTLTLLATGDTYPAAKACAEFTLDGLKDFYLGARREYALAYANVPEQFKQAWHFTSTQYSGYDAWGQF